MSEDNLWWQKTPRQLSVVVDTPGWFDPFAHALVARLEAGGDRARLIRRHEEVPEGEVAFYLSCTKITPETVLARNRLNVVVHASDLPKDRGFSPLVWAILRGEDHCILSMIEMSGEVDAGDILMQRRIEFEGHELNDELRQMLGDRICDMCADLMNGPEPPHGRPQRGEPSWLRRRRPEDSRLDPSRPLTEQFDLLRVVDNQRYPAFFDFRGHRYVLKIAKQPGPEAPPSDRKDHDDA